jgi:hypothetical protein
MWTIWAPSHPDIGALEFRISRLSTCLVRRTRFFRVVGFSRGDIRNPPPTLESLPPYSVARIPRSPRTTARIGHKVLIARRCTRMWEWTLTDLAMRARYGEWNDPDRGQAPTRLPRCGPGQMREPSTAPPPRAKVTGGDAQPVFGTINAFAQPMARCLRWSCDVACSNTIGGPEPRSAYASRSGLVVAYDINGRPSFCAGAPESPFTRRILSGGSVRGRRRRERYNSRGVARSARPRRRARYTIGRSRADAANPWRKVPTDDLDARLVAIQDGIGDKRLSAASRSSARTPRFCRQPFPAFHS